LAFSLSANGQFKFILITFPHIYHLDGLPLTLFPACPVSPYLGASAIEMLTKPTSKQEPLCRPLSC
jgi:hypothetical protein